MGNLEAAGLALEPVLTLPPTRRIDSLPQRLGRVRAELASPHYQGSALARELDERIEEFTRDTIVGGLHERGVRWPGGGAQPALRRLVAGPADCVKL